MKYCSFESCTRQAESLGFCGSHYAQYRRGETPQPLKSDITNRIAKDRDILWMAGLFEGEGCVTIYLNKNGYAYPKVTLGMSDEDVVIHLQESVGFGKIHKRTFKRKKPMWYWSISDKKEILLFLKTLLPEMGIRRSEKFTEAIEIIEESMAEQVCIVCLDLYPPRKRGTKYCSIKCRKRASR